MTAADAAATCYFLDVGQGTSQIIYLGRGRAIVIDGGPSASVPLEFLSEHVHTIVSLIVSHNDADHLRGARSILEKYQTEWLRFLVDRPVEKASSQCWKELIDLAERLESAKTLKVERLERRADMKPIYEDPRTGLCLDLLYPNYMDNLRALRTGDPNATCGVLVLSCGTRRLVFSGDATLAAWKKIRGRLGAPILCDVLTVPHHGGVIWEDSEDATAEDALSWLYSDVIRSDYAIISVGTNNAHEHPIPVVVRVLRKKSSGSPRVLCTEITGRCCVKEDEATLKALADLRKEWPAAGRG